MIVLASKASKVEHQSLVYGILSDKKFVEFCGLLWKKNEDKEEVARIAWDEAKLAHKAVLDLVANI